jgi:class 3 adenylate cyclase
MTNDHPSHQRKLAVILHADVVDSTGLVQKNETVAHQKIQEAFQRLSRFITSYGGVAHEIRGDALVAEFARASDSVCAALAFQADSASGNGEFTDNIQCKIRIGISLGEVVIADGTVTGGGVVMAQRLEQLAEPGGVVVQGTVSETVPVRLPFSFTSLGEQILKGFEQPVRAFTAVKTPGGILPEPELKNADPGTSGGSADTDSKPALPEKNRPSIAVLPFTNMSGDPEQEFFSDGITEDIITEFARFNDLFVIARNSSFVFKNQSVDITEVGHKLGVEYVVEGSETVLVLLHS